MKKPNLFSRYAGFIVDRPFVTAGVSLFFALVFTLALSQSNIQVDTEGRSFRVFDVEISDKSDSFASSITNTVFNPNKANFDPDPVQSVVIFRSTIIFKSKNDGNLLTESSIRFMRTVEDRIYGLKDYENFCHLVNGSCSRPQSITSFFYSLNSQNEYEFTSDFSGVLNSFKSNPDLVKPYIGADFNQRNNESSAWLLSRVSFGSPLTGYVKALDNSGEQETKIDAWAREFYDYVSTLENSDIEVYYLGTGLNVYEITKILVRDALLSIGAMIVVWAYMSYHLKSMFLSSWAMLHIILSFTVAQFIYRYFLGVNYITALNGLAIFIILGIGADDVFIVTDLWLQLSSLNSRASIKDKFIAALRFSSKTMLATSVTTSASFFINFISPIPAIAYFGLFCGFMILSNYLLVITFYPGILIIYTKYRKGVFCCKFWGTKKNVNNSSSPEENVEFSQDNAEDTNIENESQNLEDVESTAILHTTEDMNSDSENVENEKEETVETVDDEVAKPLNKEYDIHDEISHPDPDDVDVDRIRKLEKFLFLTASPFLYKRRKELIGISVVLFIILVSFASQIKPADEPAQFLPEDSKLQVSIDSLVTKFASPTIANSILFVFGINDVDRSHIPPLNSDLDPIPIYDSNFDPSSQAAIQFMLNLCQDVKNLPDVISEDDVFCPVTELINRNNNQFPANFSDFTTKIKQLAVDLDSSLAPSILSAFCYDIWLEKKFY